MLRAKPLPRRLAGYLRAKDAAAHLGVNPSTLWKWAQGDTDLTPIKLGPKITVFAIEGLERFVQRHAAQEVTA